MTEEIRVTVCKYGPNRPLALRWTDPITGQRKAKSAGTTNKRQAERLAGELEKSLRAGLAQCPGRITWGEFRQRYEAEKLSSLAERTFEATSSALNHVERVLNPGKLSALTSATMSKFQAALRKEGMKETTLASHLRHLKAAFNWAVSMELMSTAPKIEMPRKAKGQKVMRGRPITGEEFERMLMAVPKVRPDDSAAWQHYLRGLWLCGLRLTESLALSWEPNAPISVDLMGGRPALRFRAEGQKSGRAEIVPVTPDFGEFLLATPEAERHGPVFKLNGLQTGQPITPKRVGRIVARIGKRAGVVVNTTTKRDKRTVKPVEVTEHASAHDLRRSFGSRWARKAMPAVLRRLMRHSSIETTMRYYVDLDADAMAEELWKGYEAAGSEGFGNTFGNTGHIGAENKAGIPADTSTETPGGESLYESGGQGTRTLNRQAGT